MTCRNCFSCGPVVRCTCANLLKAPGDVMAPGALACSRPLHNAPGSTSWRFLANPGHLRGMSDNTPARVPAGTPDGGRFTRQHKPEAGVSLLDSSAADPASARAQLEADAWLVERTGVGACSPACTLDFDPRTGSHVGWLESPDGPRVYFAAENRDEVSAVLRAEAILEGIDRNPPAADHYSDETFAALYRLSARRHRFDAQRHRDAGRVTASKSAERTARVLETEASYF